MQPVAFFGNSSAQKTGTTGTTGGLFGNSGSNASAQSGSLFGNSGTNAAAPSAPPGGLFGNTGANASAPSGGLFGNSQTNKPTGLFGGSTTGGSTTGGGLFGSTSSGNNGGLFGNSATSNTAAPSTGGLFGNSNNNILNSMNTTNNSSNPYNYDTTFSRIRQNVDQMPKSITESLFNNNENKNIKVANTTETASKKRRASSTFSIPSSSSLLSKLGQTLRYFRSGISSATPERPNDSDVKGIFTPVDFINYKSINNIKKDRKKEYKSESLRIKKPSNSDKITDVKRLIIKTKPLKFHLIDTDKVFNTKRRRVLIGNETVIPSDKILAGDTTQQESDSEDSDIEEDNQINRGSKKESVSIPRFQYSKMANSTRVEEQDDESKKLDDKDLNNGYWCSPSITELSKLSMKDLAKVQDFVIGRDGFGQIAYDYPVDISISAAMAKASEKNLNEILFDNIFQFQEKVILVYKNEEKKPSIGSGFNVPATISISNMFPNKKRSENIGNYIKKLKSIPGLDFVTYDQSTGTWVFKVVHFSVWGLIDEDDEQTDPSLVAIKRKQDELEEESRLEASKIYGNASFNEEMKRQRIKSYSNNVPGAWDSKSESQLQNDALKFKRSMVDEEVKQQLKLFQDDQRMHHVGDEVADITIDEEEEQGVVSPKIFQDDVNINEVVSGDIESSHYEIDDTYGLKQEKIRYLKQLVSVLPRNLDLDDLVDEKAYEPEITNDGIFQNIQKTRPNLAVSGDWLVQLELSNDFNSSLNPIQLETKRKGLDIDDMDGLLFGNNFNQDASKVEENREIVIEKEEEDIVVHQTDFEISRVVKDMISKSTIFNKSEGYPRCELIQYSFKDLLEVLKDEVDESVLQLCFALFGEHDVPDVDQSNVKLVNHLQKLQQRRVLSKWFNEYNSEVNTLQVNNVGDDIFNEICLGNLEKAIEVAINSNNSHLSVLLTLLDANDAGVRTTALAQLQYWNLNDTTNLIPNSIYKIYKILASEFKDVTRDLPWNIGLALKYIYGDTSVKLEELIEECKQEKPSGEIFEIFSLYQKLSQDDKSGLDFIETTTLSRKLKWIISVVLSSKNSLEIPRGITLEFGEYLLKNGLWKDAIFVYSTLSDSGEYIRKVVFQNISSISVNDQYLVEVLKIPQTLIYEAIAEVSLKNGDHWEQCQALLSAKLWTKTSECIFNYIGPSTVISNNANDRQRLLEIVDQIPNRGSIIPNWSQGAGIYYQYVKLLQAQQQLQEETKEERDLLQSLIMNIPLIKNVSNLSFTNSVALKIISKRVGDLAIKEGGVSTEKILSLILGENEEQYFKVRLGEAKV